MPRYSTTTYRENTADADAARADASGFYLA
jgi:hypothetical protein